uniref:BZIP domain-containing protein n=1 Tax=Kalanchoe fedtschenkoi TaxID=63787 RepID=A0A7N0RFU0_KALFE
MASSRVMSSSTTTNSDLPPPPAHPPSSQRAQFPSIGVQIDHSRNAPPDTMDDILKNINIYVDVPLSPDLEFGNGDAAGGFMDKTTPSDAVVANDVWKEMVAGTGQIVGGGGMTLEEYLSKTTPAVGGGGGMGNGNAEAVRVGVFGGGGSEAQSAGMVNGGGGGGGQFQLSHHHAVPAGQQRVVMMDGRVAGGMRGKRKAVEEPVVDKATQQKQRRMIKNRESAARSRERKQQYTNELEEQVMQLEEERAQLMREEVRVFVAQSAVHVSQWWCICYGFL